MVGSRGLTIVPFGLLCQRPRFDLHARFVVQSLGDVVDDVASAGAVRDEHRYAMWWMTWRAPGDYVVDDASSIGALRDPS